MPTNREVLGWLQDETEPFGHRGFRCVEETGDGWEAECQDCGLLIEIGFDFDTDRCCLVGAQDLPQCSAGAGEDYSDLTDAEFDKILAEIVGAMSPEKILAIKDVYNILVEELNDEVLSRWEARKRGFKNEAVYELRCHEKRGGFICTRTREHEGDCAAYAFGGRVVATWSKREGA